MSDYALGEYSQSLDDYVWEAAGNEYEKDYAFTELLTKINDKNFF